MTETEVYEIYTPFPNFDHKVPSIEADGHLSTIWQCEEFDLSKENVIFSWATLLQSYTEAHEPVFSFYGVPIKVNVSEKTWVEVKIKDFDHEGNHTAIISDDLDASTSVTLSLSCGRQNKNATLRSARGLPTWFLAELTRQLKCYSHHSRTIESDRSTTRDEPELELSIINPSPQLLEGPSFLHELFARDGPTDVPAIDFLNLNGKRTILSYHMVHLLSDSLAKRLEKALVTIALDSKDVVIPVLLPQSPELYIAWLAVLKCGAAFCPISLDAPPERIKFIIEDVSADVVVTTQTLQEKFSAVENRIEVLVADMGIYSNEYELPSHDVGRRQVQYSPGACQRIAYVMYTSGSTGTPKGVAVSHRAATQALLAHNEHIPAFKRFLQFAAPTFDVSVFEVFFPWYRGATLVGCDRSILLDDLASVIGDLDVDAAELTPTVVGSLLKSRDAAPSLRILLTIGEMLTRAVVEDFGSSATRQGILYGMYGPTEAAIHCTIVPKMQSCSKVGIIGRPLAPVSAYIISCHGDPKQIKVLPIGQIGELALGGYQLADGYLNRPEQTASAFVETDQYGRLYLTGDKARLLPSGELECLGRCSSGQVKLRGQRIELGEIEQIIYKIKGVESATATVVNGVLVAFCLTGAGTVSASEVHDMCVRWLPKFMVPGDTVMLTRVPRLPSGKIDRKQMEAEYQSRRQSPALSEASFQGELEVRIAKVVEIELGPGIQRTTSLTAYGLDSLTAIKLNSKLLGIGSPLSVSDILRADSVSDIAKQWDNLNAHQDIKQDSAEKAATIWETIKKAGLATLTSIVQQSLVDDVVPCAPVQEAMLAETSAKGTPYFNSMSLQLAPEIGPGRVRAAIETLVQRNAMLRSGFVEIDVPGYTWARVVWNSLEPSQIVETSEFESSTGSSDHIPILRPLKVQIGCGAIVGHVLVHIHHALYDAWSWDCLMSDLQSLLSNKTPPSRLSFEGVTGHHIDNIASDSREAAREYWLEHLSNAKHIPFPNFHTKRNCSNGMSIMKRDLKLGTLDLKGFARKLHISRQDVVRGAFAYLLSTYLGSAEVVFASVASGRTLPVQGIDSIIGPCLWTLPIFLDTSKHAHIKDLLRQLHFLDRKILEYGSLPLREIKRVSGNDKDLPIFDALVIWQESVTQTDAQPKKIWTASSIDALEFALTMEIEPTDTQLSAKLTYKSSLLPPAQADMFLRQFDQLISLFVNCSEMKLEDLPLRIETTLLSMENEDFKPLQSSNTLSSSIEWLATADPQRAAIEFVSDFDSSTGESNTIRFTYGELNRWAEHIARVLVANGVGPDDLVCVFMDKSIELYVAILAAIKAGAGYSSPNPENPLERTQNFMDEAGVKVCLTTSLIMASGNVPKVERTFAIEELLHQSLKPVRLPAVSPSALAYAISTSGSTGKPKIVLVTRNNLLSNIDVLSKQYPCQEGSRLLQSCSQAFDVSVFEIFFTWHMGMCLSAACNDTIFRDIEGFVRSAQITHLSLTPTVAALIRPDHVPVVKFLVTAGEAVNAKVFNNWAGRGLWQGYGPSETTNICTVCPRVSEDDNPSNIGYVFPNTSVFVAPISGKFQMLPRGAVGELCFGGDQVCRGYHDMPHLNAEKFFTHPSYGRIYRSGDLGRLLPDGSIVFHGRQDDQIKLRGHRIELGEIDRTFLESSIVQDCFTLITEGRQGQPHQLVSFWTGSPELNIANNLAQDNAVLLQGLQARLPGYMIPSALLFVQSMPRTTQGKVDKRKLLHLFSDVQSTDPALFYGEVASTNEEPFSEQDEKIRQIICGLTNTEASHVSRNTSFFALGLDSISAITLARRLREVGVGRIDVSNIMRNSSISRLSKYLSGTSNSPMRCPAPDLRMSFDAHFVRSTKELFAQHDYEVLKLLPCTSMQDAMLFKLDFQDNTTYQNNLRFRIHGDAHRVKKAWADMSIRHEILRTIFVPSDDPCFPFAQVIVDKVELPWHDGNQDSHVLGNGLTPLWSLRLFSDGLQGPELNVSIHHALYDGEAMTQLLKEVELSYEGRYLPPAVPFERFVESVLDLDQEEVDYFWAERLVGFEPRPLAGRSHEQSFEQSPFSSTKIVVTALSKIEAGCKERSMSLLIACQMVWAKLLVHYTGSADVCFGNVFSGRTIPLEGAERIIGPCFNTLPIRIMIQRGDLNVDIATRLQGLNSAILPYQLSSLRRIQAKHKQEVSLDRNRDALFDTILLLQRSSPPLNGNIWTLAEESGRMDFPIICEVLPDHNTDRISVLLHSSHSILAVDDASQMLENFETLLEQSLKDPTLRALDMSILGAHGARIGGNQLIDQSDDVGQSTNEDSDPTWDTIALKIRSILSRLSETGLDHIGMNTTIFELGLDSINAFQIACLLKKEGHNVSGADILEWPSLNGLASLCRRRMSDSTDGEPTDFNFAEFDAKIRETSSFASVPIDKSKIQSIRPCTASQSGIMAEFLHSGGELYYNHIVMRLLTQDVRNVKAAWSTALRKYEMLRTGFIHTNNAQYPFAMMTYAADAARLPWLERSSENDPFGPYNRQQLAMCALEALHEPPWALTLKMSEAEIHLQFSALHTIYDAQSLELIFADVARACHGHVVVQHDSVKPHLSAILSASTSAERGSQAFWESVGKDMLATKFPDLNPDRATAGNMATISRASSQNQSDLFRGCTHAGITLQVAGQYSWARLLSSYVGETQVSFGVVLSGRSIGDGLATAAFPCMTTVPLACHVQGSKRTVLQKLMQRNAQLTRHQFTPLTKMRQWTGTGNNLFDTIFVYQKLGLQLSQEAPWEVVEEDAKAEYAVSIELVPGSNDALNFCLNFDESILPRRQAMLLLIQFDLLLRDTICNPNIQVTDYVKSSPDALSILPAKYARLDSPVQFLHQFVERQAARTPTKIALEFASGRTSCGVFDKRTWTYQELDRVSNQIAQLLRTDGAISSGMIGICFDKCPEASFAILAVLKLGCAYVALDPGAPPARKKFIIEDSKCEIVLCTTEFHRELQDLEVPSVSVITLDDSGRYKQLSSQPPKLSGPIRPGDPCYCLYTSGTTGTPKGVVITHDNAVQAMLAFQHLFAGHWDDGSRWLQFASFHFDVSILEQFWSWSVGICVTSAPRDVLFEDLPAAIRDLQITHLDLTPSLARLLLPDEVPSLCKGVFITGGEQLRQDILDAWGDRDVLYNGYGPTEVTIGCTMNLRVPKHAKPSNIGPPYPNVGAYVLEPNTEVPVLRGGIGELCLSGPLVGQGYLNRPELTEAKFIYLEAFQQRIYRTGDLVRLLHDDSFVFSGRIDDQVKLRGQRLEVAEIDHIIRAGATCVKEVATLVLRHPKQSNDQLVSFVSLTRANRGAGVPEVEYEHRVLLANLRECCRKVLPGYMVPTHIIPISFMPLSPNNKIESKVLKAIYDDFSAEKLQSLSAPKEKTPDANETDVAVIVDILATMTEVPITDIKSSSSIFELGLDSISVLSFTRKLKAKGYPAAQPSLVMKNSVISYLASALQASISDGSAIRGLQNAARQAIAAFAHKYRLSAALDLHLDLHNIARVAPCTPLQEGMIYKSLESGGRLYLSDFSYELGPDIDIGRLKAAWEEVQLANEILRTSFVLTDDGYAQVVLLNSSDACRHINVPNAQAVADVAHGEYKDWRERSRNLDRPPWEVLFVTSSSLTLMCLHIFHGLYDGNSLPLLLHEVAATYLQLENKRSRPSYYDVLPLGPLCEVRGSKDFWVKHLSKPKTLDLPDINPNIQNGVELARTVIEHTSALLKIRKTLKISEQAIFHACWLLALQRTFGVMPTLGIVVSGRSINVEGVEGIIGPMFNTIPCHVDTKGLSSWSELVRRCHEFNVGSMPYQHTPLREILKWTRQSSQSLFNTLIVFQKELDGDLGTDEGVWTPRATHADADYPLALEAQRNLNGTVTLTLIAQSRVVDSRRLQQLIMETKKVLHELLETPDRELSPQEKQSALGQDDNNNEQAAVLSNGIHHFEWTLYAQKLRETIASLAEVDIESIDEKSSIFELGLDSIDATRLSSRLKKVGITLSFTNIMRYGTIEKMSTNINASPITNGADHPRFSLQKAEDKLRNYFQQQQDCDLTDIERILPVTPLQEGMLAEMSSSNFDHYFNHDLLELAQDVELDQLKSAWEAVIAQHPILRTSFTEVDDPGIPFSFAQFIHEPTSATWNSLEIAGEEEIAQVQYDVKCQASRKFGTSPMLFLTIIRFGARRILLLSMAHALYDGWSLGLLHNDVAAAYAGRECERPSYAPIIEHILSSSDVDSSRFWRSALAGVTPTLFPQRQTAESTRVHHEEKVSSTTAAQLVRLCKSHNITAQTLGLSCWAMLLASYVRRLDVCFGVIFSGRTVHDPDEMMFPTMNTVAMRAVLHGSRSEMLKYVQETVNNMTEHQHFPLRRAKAEAGFTSQPLFDTLFIYQKRPDQVSAQSHHLYRSMSGSSEVEYPVCVELELEANSVVWRTACRDSALNFKGTREMLDQIDSILATMMDNVDKPVIHYQQDRISVCGLPTFQEAEVEAEVEAGGNKLLLSQDGIEHHAESSPVVKVIRSALSAVSGTPEAEISQEMSLFHLGLDSISAIKVSSLLRKQSVILSVSDMLKAASVENMARIASEATSRSSSSSKNVDLILQDMLQQLDAGLLLKQHQLDGEEIERVLPATAGQIFMLGMWQSSAGHLCYPAFHYRVEGIKDRAQLDLAWEDLTRQLPILRTAFASTGLQSLPYLQVVLRSHLRPIIWAADSNAVLGQIPDLRSVPVQLYAFWSANGEINVTLHIHHALYDGVSLSKLIKHFQRLCCFPDRKSNQGMEFGEFVALGQGQSERANRRRFWQGYLEDIHDGSLASSRPARFERSKFYRPKAFANMKALETLARTYGLSIQTLFLAIWSKVYAGILAQGRSNGRKDNAVVFGVYLANRAHNLPSLTDLVAPTINIVPLLVRHPLETPVLEIAQEVQSDLQKIGNTENSGVTLIEIKEWTRVTVDCFVNFLSLPSGEDADTAEDQDGSVTIETVPAAESEQQSGDSDDVLPFWETDTPSWIKDAYLPSIDIEAAVRDGCLDVGVFAPRDVWDEEAAEEVLGKLQKELSILVAA